MRSIVIALLIVIPIYALQERAKVIPIGRVLISDGFADIIIDKIEVWPTKMKCHFFFKNTYPFANMDYVTAGVGITGAYVDNYQTVKVQDIVLGNEYTLPATKEKRFIIGFDRPAECLYLTGINLSGNTHISCIKLSKNCRSSAEIDASSAIATVPFRSIVSSVETEKMDIQKPTLNVNSPETSQGIFRTEEFSVIISGKATDDKGVAFVTVNGQNATLRSDGRFQKQIKLKIGTNPVVVSAIDINDNKAESKITVIREEIIEDEDFSDVDFALETRNRNLDGIAVVLGIEEYQYAPSVSYAYNDADIFREYLVKTFGYSRENIYFRTNERATKGELEKIFSANGWLAKNTTRKSDVIIFYAGHGAPDLEAGQSYLIPFDIDPNYATTGYALEDLYQNLGKLKVNSVTVILDACFSGGSRDNQPLLADARPVYISVEGGTVPKNTVVFSAASGREISSAYKQKLHGLFTYFFLKGLNGNADENKDKKITVMEMQGYLEAYVPQQARKMGREQTPTLIGKDSKRILLRY